jgi:NitT/TauT family transport system ATP-binding protein
MSAAGGADALDIAVRAKRFPAIGAAPPKLVIRDFRLRVPAGGFVALFGPSGCGKTTLLNLVAGLDADFEGRIAQPAGLRTGYVFQEPRLLPWLTVEDNLALVLGDAADAEARIAAWLAEMDLAGVGKLFANRLSLGMARRVALARAFIIEPGLLLMDEPFVSLDEPTAARLRRLLLDTLAAHPASVLFVTHSLREAVMLAERVAVLSAAPTRVLDEIEVPLSAAERRDEQAVEAARRAVLERLPAERAG